MAQSKAILIADATDAVSKLVTECNAVAGKLLVETVPFKERNVENMLAADSDRVMSLAMDLVDCRTRLAEAKAELDALKRRAQ